jgi:RNA polymerase sigma factor (sigma-70 family)
VVEQDAVRTEQAEKGRETVNREHGVATIVAAQSGDPQAQDALVAGYLPLVYNIVGRALNGHADVDDVVQDTMVRALDGLPGLRIPESFRSWLVAIAMNEVRRHWQREQQPLGAPLPEGREVADPDADFVGLTIVRMGLSGQRKETVEATRWLDADDRALLSLWWLEAAGELTRAEVATALELAPDHTAVRVQRMKLQLEAARVVVRALAAVPLCSQLREVLAPWDGAPSALWRKRISRHAKECAVCSGHRSGLVPAEGLLAGFGLVPVAGVLVELVRLAREQGVGVGSTGATQTVAHAHAPADLHSDAYADGKGHASVHASTPPARPTRTDLRRQRARRQRQVVGAVAVLLLVGGGVGAFQLFSGGTDGESSTSVADAARTGGPALPSPGASGASSAAPSPTAASPTASATASASATATRKAPAPTKSASRPAPPPAPKPTRTKTPSRPAPPPPPAGPAQEVVALLNQERAKAGCAAVTTNGQLRTAAQRHSEDMIARGYFDHTNPDGDGPGERVTAAGYKWSTYGENIAAGQSSPAAVMETWMNSSGHRANILNCSFKEIGIGIAGPSGGPHWTQVFGAR